MRKRVVSVAIACCALAPVVRPSAATAAESNAGTGGLVGTVQFATFMGVPAPTQPCQTTSWSFNGTAAGAVVDIASAEFVGPVNIAATGGAICALSTVESGTLSVSATSALSLGAFTCPPSSGGAPLTGSYSRLGTSVLIDVRGSCAVADLGEGQVEFVATGEFAPTQLVGTPPGEQVMQAAFAGGFAISPTS